MTCARVWTSKAQKFNNTIFCLHRKDGKNGFLLGFAKLLRCVFSLMHKYNSTKIIIQLTAFLQTLPKENRLEVKNLREDYKNG